MVDKIIKFNTKVIHNNNVYLKVSDVAKVFNMKMADFKQSHSDIIEKIPACGDCILETEFNKLLSEDSSAMEKQGQLEITKIESLRAKTDAVISFQSLKMLLGRSMLQQLANMKSCKSIEEYITIYELPKEMNEALKEFLHKSESNTDYTKMVDYTFHKTDKFDIEKIMSFGLDVQVLTSIKSANSMDLDVFVVGKGIFYRITNYGDYEQWDNLYTDSNGNLILPFCDYVSKSSEEIKINLSQSGIDRDFREYTVIENMIWCIENLPVTEIEDYEYDVIGCDLETIKFSVSIELLIKMIRPDAVSTLFIDKVVEIDNECYLTDVKDMRVFAE